MALLRSCTIPIVWVQGGYEGHPMYLSEFFTVSHNSYTAYNVFKCRFKDLKRREDCTSPFLRNSNICAEGGYEGYPMYLSEFFVVSHDTCAD